MVIEKVAPNIRIAGKLLRAIPFVGDAAVAATELIPQSDAQGIFKPFFSEETDAMQRAKNAALVGGGGLAASALTGGADAIPAVAELVGIVGEGAGAPKGPQMLNNMVGCSPALNVEHYLRSGAYGAKHGASNEIIRKAGERCNAAIDSVPLPEIPAGAIRF